MNHNDVKKTLFEDNELKNEYDEMSPIYELKKDYPRKN
jgi:hypothetical protein